MIVIMAIMLIAVSANEADWISVTKDAPVPINFEESKLEVKTDYEEESGDQMTISFLDSEKQKTIGWTFGVGFSWDRPHWRFAECTFSASVTISEDDIKKAETQEMVWTIWKRDGKLNVLLDGETEIVKDAEPGDRSETTCYASVTDWEAKWGSKIEYISIGYYSKSPTGYRIVSDTKETTGDETTGDETTGDETPKDDRQKLSGSAKISLNSVILVAGLIYAGIWGH